MIGTTVSHYEIREKLGAGGMGVVYKAWDTHLDRWVALKFLPVHAHDDDLSRERFVREAKAASALEHPHICTVHEIGETEEGQLFICMAFYPGGNLRQAMKERLTLQRTFEIARQISHALASAHEAGIVHRDIKPSNIMLTEQGDVAIVDFGLAKLSGEISITRSGTTMGTVAYMSPEQVQGRELDARTDLWSLGVILYQLLTGRHPFQGDYDQAVQQSILNEDPAPPSEINAELPEHIDPVVAKLLAKDRRSRFSSGAELEQTFKALGQPTDPEMPTQWDLGPHSGTRVSAKSWWMRPATAVSMGTLIILGILIAKWPFSPPGEAPVQTLAVLPFTNETGEPSRSYLCDGLAAGLITTMEELRGLDVLSRAEAWRYRDRDWEATRIGERLGVDTVLEGTVQGESDVVTVSTWLTDVATGGVLWSEEVQGAIAELPEMSREVASRLANVLEVRLSKRERGRLLRDPTKSFRAYELYLRGQELLADYHKTEDLDAAVQLFRQAIGLDPSFVLAHVALSEAYWEVWKRDGDQTAFEMAEEESKLALELDPELPAALVAAARIQRSEGRYTDSIAALEDALAMHPNPDAAHRELALGYERAGDLESAEAALRAATVAGAENWLNWNHLGAFLWGRSEYQKAREAFQEAIDLAPEGVLVPHRNLGANEVSRGNWEEAIRALEGIPESRLTASLASNLGTAYYFSERPDRMDKAEYYYEMAARLSPRDDQFRRNLADVYLRQGAVDSAHAQYREALRLIEERLESDPEDWSMRLRRSFYSARAADCPTALGSLEALSDDLPSTAANARMSAYVYALCGQTDSALQSIAAAIEMGIPAEFLREEPEFETLRGDPSFQLLTGPDG